MARRNSIPRGLYKRGRIWWCCYAVGTTTVRESTGKTNREDAEDVLDAIKQSIRTGEYVPEHRRPQIIPHPWETSIESYLRDRTLRGRRDDSYKRLPAWSAAFAGRDVADIKLEDVEIQLAAWKTAKSWAPATYNNALAQVSGVFTYAYRQGWIERHPLRGRVERLAENNGRERYFYPHELAAMVRTARALARLRRQPLDWLRNIIEAAAFTGLRKSVFCELRCRDVRKDEHGELWLRVARDKNGEPVEKRLAGRLADVAQERIDSALPMAYLFPGPRGKKAYKALDGEGSLRLVVERVGKRNPEWGLRWGVKGGGVTFHSFRHAMASLALNAGVPRDIVQRMGNWKTAIMVARYAHRADEHVREAEEKLAQVLGFSVAKPEQLHTTSQSGSKADAAARARRKTS